MPTSLYNFQYVPLTGRLPGKSFVRQTEQAINGLARYVYDNSTNYEAVKAIAQKAEEYSSSAFEYSEQALDKAQTALETVGRAYIKTTSAVDLDDYYDSELLLILSEESTNLPASISGYLTVMSSDTHDYCMQVYIGIDGSVYKRTATISNNTPTFRTWSETPITLSSLQAILTNYTTVDASNIGVNAETDNSELWGSAIGGGEIAESEQRLITGGTIYPLSQNVAQNTSNIATNTADIAQNTGGISANSKRIGNIEKLLQGNLYDYQTDSTSAYTKTVPSGAMPYAGIEKIGGKTIVMNQLIQNGNFESASGWQQDYSTISVSENILTMQPSEKGRTTFNIRGNNLAFDGQVVGHKYLVSVDVLTNLDCNINAQTYGIGSYVPVSANTWTNINAIRTVTTEVTGYSIQLNVYTGSASVTFDMSAKVQVKNYTVFDLTLLYGSGNEPSTVEEFEAMFPADYYAYNAGELLSAGVTSVVSHGQNEWNSANLLSNAKYTINADGSVTISASNYSVNTATTLKTICPNIQAGKTYTLQGFGAPSSSQLIYLLNGAGSWVFGTSKTLTENDLNATVLIYGAQSSASDYAQTHTIYFDLMEGQTAPTSHIPYKAPITYPIPAEIQSLDGYGWSAGSVYNYIDFERKVFVQNVARVDLGSLTWNSATDSVGLYFYAAVTDKANGFRNIVCSKYPIFTASISLVDMPDKMLKWQMSGANVYCRDSAYANKTDFKNAMDGVYLYYELATPIETDISEYLTDDNLIEVEAGGSLTFPNSNGTDYQIPVPSEEEYMIDLQEAVSNG